MSEDKPRHSQAVLAWFGIIPSSPAAVRAKDGQTNKCMQQHLEKANTRAHREICAGWIRRTFLSSDCHVENAGLCMSKGIQPFVILMTPSLCTISSIMFSVSHTTKAQFSAWPKKSHTTHLLGNLLRQKNQVHSASYTLPLCALMPSR